ncbi:MAG: hypothetical protein GY898_18285 [Proteobacteria bacterium]|nr:hypothetical protein [Pseudomonadota bacterium]
MARSALLLLLPLLTACSAPAFTVTLSNDGTEPTYIDVGTGRMVSISEMRSDGEALVTFSQYELCAPVCGAVTGAGCASRAPMISSAFALLPGDTTDVGFDGGNAWYLSNGYEGQCIRRTALDEPIRVTVCRDDTVQDWDGLVVDPPDVSGTVDNGNGAIVVEPVCEQAEFDLAESTDLFVSLED